MKSNKALTWTATVVMISVLCGTAWAGKHERGFGKHGGGGGMGLPGMLGREIIQVLNLSDEQKTKVAEMLKTHQTEIRQNMEAVMTARDRLMDVIHAEGSTEADVQNAARAVSAATESGALMRFKVHTAIKAILTPEQTARFNLLQEIRSTRRNMRPERMDDRFDDLIELLED